LASLPAINARPAGGSNAPDKRQKAILWVLLIIILLGMLLVVVIPMVGAQSDTETLFSAAKACTNTLSNVTDSMGELSSSCGYAAWRIERISEGYKVFTLASFALFTAVNAAMVYWLIRKG
jgi:hypothetical protein